MSKFADFLRERRRGGMRGRTRGAALEDDGLHRVAHGLDRPLLGGRLQNARVASRELPHEVVVVVLDGRKQVLLCVRARHRPPGNAAFARLRELLT